MFKLVYLSLDFLLSNLMTTVPVDPFSVHLLYPGDFTQVCPILINTRYSHVSLSEGDTSVLPDAGTYRGSDVTNEFPVSLFRVPSSFT